MLIGVYVTSSHQGRTCPDWPLCPNGLFSVPTEKYLFEYIHRLMVVIAASVIIATAVYCVKHVKQAKRTAILAALIVCLQIFFGYLIVTLKTPPLLVATHLSTGITLFAMTLMTFLATHKATKRSADLTL
jgi:cytochrome c oxidase assembly protein subunit 15